MSIARAFTTRRPKLPFSFSDSSDSTLHRSQTVKHEAAKDALRAKISAPLALVHTTNMLSYNAPDIHPRTPTSSSSQSFSGKSDDDSVAESRASSPPTSPDTPFILADKFAPELPKVEPNHLSCYFQAPGTEVDSLPTLTTAPLIPQRAPSHKKPAGNILSRQRSESRLSDRTHRTLSSKGSFSFSRASSTSTATTVSSRSASAQSMTQKVAGVLEESPSTTTLVPEVPEIKMSTAMTTSPIPAVTSPTPAPLSRRTSVEKLQPRTNPFGHELAQVRELAEEMSTPQIKISDADREEEQYLVSKGLRKFRPEEYIAEIQGLLESFFGSDNKSCAPVWI